MTHTLEPPSVIDAHARLAPTTGAPERLLAAMAAHGIAQTVVSAGGVVDMDRLSLQIAVGGHVTGDADNVAVVRAAAASQGRLVPVFFANPHTGVRPYRELADRVHGVELSPAVHGVDLDDPRTVELVAAAADEGHPVYVVCLPRAGASVPDLALLAGAFPEVTFVLGHAGATAVDLYGLDVVAPCPNVVVETSCALTASVTAALERVGPNRVLFGTEYPHQHPAVELAKLASLGLPPNVRAQVAVTNAQRVFRLPPVPPVQPPSAVTRARPLHAAVAPR